jgi:methylated-DNA-protein-cysteine methyltransferase-like protein
VDATSPIFWQSFISFLDYCLPLRLSIYSPISIHSYMYPQTSSIPDKNRDFFQAVFAVVRLIPAGKVTSYGAIARYLGSAKSSRMVGWAMNASHKLPGIPAHRVVNRNGLLTGKMHFETPETMALKLAEEGIMVQDNQVQNFKSVFWDPSVALELP